ncbi:MAG: hypothetical protein EOP47_11905 [Sphingobacteriaceae bacterium]|nr:MAG: hypothetical protein EOP47_11905 [Sphingobacteriaceae bacterium]
MKHFFSLFIICSILNGCKTSKLDCYNSNLNDISATVEYQQVMKSARVKLPLLKGKTGESLFKQKDYIDSAIIDKAVFFNRDKTKCILLLLRQTDRSLYLDNALIIQGSKENQKWIFRLDRLPEVPETDFVVNKSGPRSNPLSNTFDELSAKTREFVLTGGTVSAFNCEIDEKYWFGND